MTDCAGFNVEGSMRDGTLTVEGVSMHVPSWVALDVTALWGSPGVRGDDLLIPGRPGLISMPRRITGTSYSVPMVVDGRFTYAGSVRANAREGLRANVAALVELVSGAARVVTLTTPDASATLTGAAHVALTLGDQTRSTMRVVMDLDFPEGGLVAPP